MGSTFGKRVLLTGATGFIGRNLVEAWRDSHDLRTPTRAELDLTRDESVAAFFARNEFDLVVHSATTAAHRNAAPVPDVAFRNLRMFANLMRHDGAWDRLIVLGSGAEYDARHYSPRMSEEQLGRHVPVDPSGFSKFVVSRLAESHPRVTVLRLFGVYGPHEDWEIRFISNAICKALFDRPITLRQNRRFDYLWVGDLAPVIAHFAGAAPSPERAYNVTPDESIDLLDLARLVRDVSGKSVEIRVAEAGMGPEYTGDNTRLRKAMPGIRFTPARAGIETLWRWYEAHRASIRPEALAADK